MSSPHKITLHWRKAERSSSTGNDCVEVADLGTDGTAVRDSKDPAGPRLSFSAAEWAAFARRAKAGTLDL